MQNLILPCKNQKIFVPVVGSSLLRSYCQTAINIFFLNSNPGIYKDIAEDVETRFDTSNFELDQPLPKGKNKKRYCTNER